MLTTVHLGRDRRKEQQQQLASYMKEHDGDVVGFDDTRLGENAGIMVRNYPAADYPVCIYLRSVLVWG